jgi:fucose 4-O-acetylase-like acetyltransferase
MDLKDVVGLFVTATAKIEFYWNFYVVMLIALIGWLVSVKKPLSTSLKSLITVGYVVFIAMNVLGLYGSYTFAEALRTDLLSMEGAKALPHTHKVLQTHSYVGQRTGMFWIHAIVGVAILLVVWLGHFGEKNGEESGRRQPET